MSNKTTLSAISTLDKIRSYFLYLIARYRTYINIILGAFIVLFVVYWVATTNKKNLDVTSLDSWWNAWGDPVTGLSTFLVAIVIWLSNTAKDWEDRLDKKLTVIYQLPSENNREVIRCENAFLAHEGDIRNWGQSLGQQTIGKNQQHRLVYFDFSNSMEVRQPDIKLSNGHFYKHYTAIFYLKSLPKDILENGEDLSKGSFKWEAGKENATFEPLTNIHQNVKA